MQDHTDPDPDVVAYTLQVAQSLVPGLSAELAKQVEDAVKRKYGGRRFFIPKGVKRLTLEQRAALYRDGLSSMATEEIALKHKVSRRTIYNIMKEGGRFS